MDGEKLEKFTDRIMSEVKNFFGHLIYNFSVLHCLPQSMVFPDSAAIGTVFNPSKIQELALKAGFSKLKIVPVENDFWRFYPIARKTRSLQVRDIRAQKIIN